MSRQIRLQVVRARTDVTLKHLDVTDAVQVRHVITQRLFGGEPLVADLALALPFCHRFALRMRRVVVSVNR